MLLTLDSPVRGYKAMDRHLRCANNFQYEVGREYSLPEGEVLTLCKRGFHFCLDLVDCFDFYSPGPDARICEVVALGHVVGESRGGWRRGKCATDHIRIVRELLLDEVLAEMASVVCNPRGPEWRRAAAWGTGSRLRIALRDRARIPGWGPLLEAHNGGLQWM